MPFISTQLEDFSSGTLEMTLHPSYILRINRIYKNGFLLFRGQISPAVENVKVSVIAPSEAAVVNKMAAAVSHTDASGKFRLGPLPQETQESGQYRVEAVKEGYVFEQVCVCLLLIS